MLIKKEDKIMRVYDVNVDFVYAKHFTCRAKSKQEAIKMAEDKAHDEHKGYALGINVVRCDLIPKEKESEHDCEWMGSLDEGYYS
jgi:hypothetical protein